MPLYQFRCPDCKFLTKRLMLKPERLVECKGCQKELDSLKTREFADTSSNSKEIIDNGIMTRQVENFANSNELLQNRNHVVNTRRKKNEL